MILLIFIGFVISQTTPRTADSMLTPANFQFSINAENHGFNVENGA